MLDILSFNDLTKRDIIVAATGFFLAVLIGLAGAKQWIGIPIIVSVTFVPGVRLIEYYHRMRISATTLARVVDNEITIRRIRNRHRPPTEYVMYRPVVEFETKDGTVRMPYAFYRPDNLFVVGEEYEICYSVAHPEVFCFSCRSGEIPKRYFLTLGVIAFFVIWFYVELFVKTNN